MNMLTLYGIPNCDTIKKAQIWLQNRGLAFDFHNYKKEGITAQKIETWLSLGYNWEDLVNKRGTTWKALAEQPTNTEQALAAMLANPSLIRRPIVEKGGVIYLIGFDEKIWEQKLMA